MDQQHLKALPNRKRLPVRPTNVEAYWEIDKRDGDSLKVVADKDVYLTGVFIPELAEHATSGGLQLGFEVPECFRPKELPKVPRATIALLKAHVEEQFRIARITKKLTNTNKRTELWKNPEPGETIYMVSKALQGDLKARGALMNTTEQMFWGCMIESFKTPATLIDSCRGEFYNAAGARAGAVKAEPTPVQKIWTQKDFFIEETAEV